MNPIISQLEALKIHNHRFPLQNCIHNIAIDKAIKAVEAWQREEIKASLQRNQEIFDMGSGDNNCIKPACDKPDSIKQKADCLEQTDIDI